ncbi:MAG: hypothetical protein HYT80_05190 [Euryarchaeota archaeon]|nr:hypothetical protein [Euryarchaeota archaeon]
MRPTHHRSLLVLLIAALVGATTQTAWAARPAMSEDTAPYEYGESRTHCYQTSCEGEDHASAMDGRFGFAFESPDGSTIEAYPFAELGAVGLVTEAAKVLYIDALVDLDVATTATADNRSQSYAAIGFGFDVLHDACPDCHRRTWVPLVDAAANCNECEDHGPETLSGQQTLRGFLFLENGYVPPGNLTIRVGLYGESFARPVPRTTESGSCMVRSSLVVVCSGSDSGATSGSALRLHADATLQSVSVLVPPPEKGPKGPKHDSQPANTTRSLFPAYEEAYAWGGCCSANRMDGSFSLHTSASVQGSDGFDYDDGYTVIIAYADVDAAHSIDLDLVLDLEEATTTFAADDCGGCRAQSEFQFIAWTRHWECDACDADFRDFSLASCATCQPGRERLEPGPFVVSLSVLNWDGGVVPPGVLEVHLVLDGRSSAEKDTDDVTSFLDGASASGDLAGRLAEIRLEAAPAEWPPV